MVVWAMLITGSALASSGLFRYLGPFLVAPFYYATPTNHWAELYLRMPAALVPSQDPKSDTVKRFFEGLSSGGHIPWAAWVRPLFWWGLFFALFYLASACMSVLVRRQWADRERLVFPLVQLPLWLAEEPAPGRSVNPWLRNRLLWLGAAIPMAIHLINGLRSYYATVPGIPLTFLIGPSFPTRPWNALGIWDATLYFSVVGFCYLLASDVAFSLWFFFLAFRLVQVARSALGVEPYFGSAMGWPTAVSVGGYAAWGLYMAWVARGYVAEVARKVWTGAGGLDDSQEALSYRKAAGGLLFSFAAMVAWLAWAGMSDWLAAITLALLLFTIVILTRVVAEAGLLFVQSSFVPNDIVVVLSGTQGVTTAGWAISTLQQSIFAHDLRETYMPSVLNSLQLKRAGGTSPRGLMGAIALAVAVGYVVSAWSFLRNSYLFGGVNLDGWGDVAAPQTFFNKAIGYIHNPRGPEWPIIWHLVIGAALTLAVVLMRFRFVWWPFHPAGIVLAPVYAMSVMWFSILVSWALKCLILRYGGLRLYRRLVPFFMGLIVGEAIMGGFWIAVGLVTGVGGIRFMPG